MAVSKSSHTARYLLGIKEFNSDDYLTCEQVKEFSALITGEFEFQEHEASMLNEFLDRYYHETKISITEFNTHLMLKFKGYIQSKNT